VTKGSERRIAGILRELLEIAKFGKKESREVRINNF
jgi:hypothetical protein